MASQPETAPVAVMFLMLTVYGVGGYPEGAPTDSCANLTPRHGGSSTLSPANAPYTVTASKSTYSPGETITVTLKATGAQSFQGFLVEARAAGSTTALGTFTPASGVSKTLTCGTANSALTHVMSNPQTNLQLTWTAPQSNAGTITFWATFVQSYSSFYVGVQSSSLTSMATQTTAVTTKSTSISSQGAGSITSTGTTNTNIRSGGTSKAATVIANKTFAVFTVMLASVSFFAKF